MKTEQIVHAATIALDFYRASKRCRLKEMTSIGIPSIVCSAFSVELALKAILYSEGIYCKGHSLLKLIAKLPKGIREEIESNLIGDWPDYLLQLERCNNAFVDWRYVFELERELNVNINFLVFLSELCCDLMAKKIGISTNIPLEKMI